MAIERHVEDTGLERRLILSASGDDIPKLAAHAQRLIDRERQNWRKGVSG